MPTLRRILKYTPAVVLGLLVIVWMASCFGAVMFIFKWQSQRLHLTCGAGNVTFGTVLGPYATPKLIAGLYWEFHWQDMTGNLVVQTSPKSLHIQVPQLFLITAVLPLAAGPFLSFRFRLWHYLAYTALVAVELAYYLRWQE